ncbi:hypothetical protein Ccrd_008512 [Cynara cardunculus var. scolymus]|uniref:EF-hand domain-containing protein n=1 Tax=Cynara cardunculus var. scolymus TaxID=59895 RepID=A0A103XF21_CYNCS|nr:hypothetical protein Ccrd_008512 [Cynara cardunculus var. scolymus]
MKIYPRTGILIGFLAVLMEFWGKVEATTVTCELEYGFLPCTTGLWGRLFLIVVYQYLMSIAQSYISEGSDKFFGLVGPGVFGASLFHVLGNFPTLFIILESGLSRDEMSASTSAAMGMSILAGSAVMNLTLIWPSVIVFGSYDLADDDEDNIDLSQLFGEEPSFFKKLTAYGVTTDTETSTTARIMLVSMIPFLILMLPQIFNSDSVTRVIVLISLIIVCCFFIANIVYQIFQPWIQNRKFDYGLDQNHDGKVSSAELKTLLLGIQVQADGEVSDGLIENTMMQLDISGDDSIQEDEFVRILTKWLQEARASLSKNDYNPLSFFIKPAASTDEEQQEALLPTNRTPVTPRSVWDYVEALAYVVVGITISALIARPLIMNVANVATDAHVPSFFIPYFVIPAAISIPRLLKTIDSANVPWDVSAEILVVFVTCGVMGVFTSTRTVFPLWTGYFGYLMFPASLLMLYLLTVVWGWS